VDEAGNERPVGAVAVGISLPVPELCGAHCCDDRTSGLDPPGSGWERREAAGRQHVGPMLGGQDELQGGADGQRGTGLHPPSRTSGGHGGGL
jgi:hypothetical protein